MKYLGAPQSGSQANTTASHNRAGQYYRNRRSPVQPVGTGRRAFVRSSFGAASAAWAALSGAAQASRIAYANSHPITDSLGQSITLTGHQMYVGVGVSLLNVGQALPTAVPVSSATAMKTPGGARPRPSLRFLPSRIWASSPSHSLLLAELPTSS